MNGISALIRREPRNSLLLVPCEGTVKKMALYKLGSRSWTSSLVEM